MYHNSYNGYRGLLVGIVVFASYLYLYTKMAFID